MNFINLLTDEFIKESAIPSNLRYGNAIYARGGIEYILQKADYIEAWVGGLDGAIKEGAGSRRRVTFTISDAALQWNCTGNPKNHQIFCKHCVALALDIIRFKLK
jgi:uncharacterized Zn finger protein